MGFETVLDHQVELSSRQRNFAPKIPPADLHRMEQALQGLSLLRGGISSSQQADIGQPGAQVPSTYQGDSSGEEDEGYLQDELKPLENENDLEVKYRAQKQIDDQKIAVVYEALTKGIELE